MAAKQQAFPGCHVAGKILLRSHREVSGSRQKQKTSVVSWDLFV